MKTILPICFDHLESSSFFIKKFIFNSESCLWEQVALLLKLFTKPLFLDQVIFTGLEINTQNASDFDKLQMRKISTSKRLQVRIIHVSQTFGKNLLAKWSHKFASGKILTSQTLQVDWKVNFEVCVYSFKTLSTNCFNFPFDYWIVWF